ncbi:mucin-2-like isoform X3 [Amblyraja radiata]|uniref:mucin-2-like isoform X3 n=1 Tax=Amblyraja radiata TaxID=386614 RepID=UPI001403FF37|nr:mucin-2-like isoform X3 [Amblyraja radiata]
MKYNPLVVIWVLILIKDSSGDDNPVNIFDLSQDAITQVFKRSIQDVSKARDNHHTCKTWGTGSFKAFNNEAFYFASTCDFFMSRLCKEGLDDYEVKIRRGSSGDLEEIFIKIDTNTIVVTNGVIKVKNQRVTLPFDNKMINIHSNGVNIKFSNKKHSISLIWNGNNTLSLKLHPRYSGQVCGLCGEFPKKRNKNLKFKRVSPISLRGESMTSGNCPISIPVPVFTKPQLFQACTETFSRHLECKDAETFLKLCAMDIIAFPNKNQGHCPSIKEFARHCQIQEDWRKISGCEKPECPGNQIYSDYGQSFIPTCTDPDPQQKDALENTCVCPKGTLLDNIRHENKCIRKSECPCEYSGTIYDAGDKRNTSCETCVCKGGLWECSHHNCSRSCKVEEGTHITTFDGKYYNLRGDCTYIAVSTLEDDLWKVIIEMRECHKATKHICLRRIIFSSRETKYEFNNNGDVTLNGEIVVLPLQRDGTIIFKPSSHFIQLETTHGLKMQIQISPIMQLYVSLLDGNKRSLGGLCGNFNGKAIDDFTSVQNVVEPSHVNFAHSWAADVKCSPPEKESPTCVSSTKEFYAKERCALLKTNGVFAQCHSTVDYIQYYQMCKISICNCENLDHCICAALGAYVHACAARGVILRGWSGTICNTTCKNSHIFDNEMTTCNRNCKLLTKTDFTCDVKDTPVYGCGCPEGKYMNENGACVNAEDCSCYYKGIYIQPGEEVDDCYCQGGSIGCNRVTEATTTPTVCTGEKELIRCSPTENQIHCGKKCSKLALNCPNECVPGCFCPEGTAEDDSGNCVLTENCPCLYEGSSYAIGTEIQLDCSQCECQGGSWSCTDKPCTKTCQVYGEGHYITFDDFRFTYEGNCEYIFVQDHCKGERGTFQVLMENVPCCENGVTCSRNIKIIFEGKEIILEDGKVKVSDENSNSNCTVDAYSLHTIGLYLSLTFSNGITMIWDKHTRFSVTLDQRWKDKVCGLCGNFNDNTEDDLTTRFNSLASNSIEFGNSWKSTDSCPSSVNQTFPCEENPFCSPWATKKCSIVTNPNGEFQQCHSKVDPNPYYEACLQEACACDKEGKYLGFCTAVAVYAEACNKAGVCIRWRTPERCPVYCDYYNDDNECSWHYKPCGTLTAKTCSNHTIKKKLSAVIEGCYPKCPEAAPYLDENLMKCVRLHQCTCLYNGQIYNANENIIGCGNCECTDGRVICEETNCAGYWSPWNNRHQPKVTSRGDHESPEGLCNPSHSPNDIQCQAIKYPKKPISETSHNVTCDLLEGLECTPSSNDFLCPDYRIRVCCVLSTTITTLTTTPTTTVTTTPTTTTPTTTTPTTTTPTTTVTTTPTTTPSTTSSTTVLTTLTTTTTTSSSTVSTPTTTTTVISTTPSTTCPCSVNKERQCTGTWTEDCAIKQCDNGTTTIVKQCMTKKPTCANNLNPIEVINECGCADWECGCECEVYGDPHYKTFNQLSYDFYERCTYVLMEEQNPKYNLRVLVDNYNCISFVPFSCPKGLIIFYENVNIVITTHNVNMLTIDGIQQKVPYITNGIWITELPDGAVNIYFTDIKTTIVASRLNFKLRVAEHFFLNNTQGQCGTCTTFQDDDCIRPDGTIEDTDCCPTTARDWLYNDTNKPYCVATTPAPCSTPTPTPTPPVPPNCMTLCMKILETSFENCTNSFLVTYYENCLFDCATTNSTELACSIIQSAADNCGSDTCVDWRSPAGECKMNCTENLIYKACATQLDDYCEDNSVMTGGNLLNYHEGCFCPAGMMKSEDKTKCVSTCCLDINGTRREINDKWQDQNNACTSYRCTKYGVKTHTLTCAAQEDCIESDKKWDDKHCCYTCVSQGLCKRTIKITNVTKEVQNTNCTASIELYVCEGNCPGSVYYDTQTHKTERKCECCQEMGTEDRIVALTCQDGRKNELYTYPRFTSCRCKKEVCPGASAKKPHTETFF